MGGFKFAKCAREATCWFNSWIWYSTFFLLLLAVWWWVVGQTHKPLHMLIIKCAQAWYISSYQKLVFSVEEISSFFVLCCCEHISETQFRWMEWHFTREWVNFWLEFCRDNEIESHIGFLLDASHQQRSRRRKMSLFACMLRSFVPKQHFLNNEWDLCWAIADLRIGSYTQLDFSVVCSFKMGFTP